VATTSPDNLRTPDPSDPYNLVPDLATLSGDVQTALNKRSITSGTVAQRTTFTSTATAGWLWQDTDGIKMIWRKDGAVWVPAVWRWSGTNSEMTSFSAPNGFEWFNTTAGDSYIKVSGSWLSTPTPQGGVITGITVASQGSQQRTVTFAKPFPTVPIALANGLDSPRDVTISVKSVSTTQMVVEAGSNSTVSRTLGISWIALPA
jgi:hypothetical protein